MTRNAATVSMCEKTVSAEPISFARNERGRAVEAVLAISNSDIAVASNDELLLADSGNARIRRIDRNGKIDTVTATFDGPTSSLVRGGTFGAWSVDVSPGGSIDFSSLNSTYVMSSDGILRRSAGNGSGKCKFTGDDGPALSADLCQAWDVTRDAAGDLVISVTLSDTAGPCRRRAVRHGS